MKKTNKSKTRKKTGFKAKFNIGDRVNVELDGVPKEQRLCTLGTIVKIAVRFPDYPSIRRIFYLIRFDKNYLKPEYRFTSSGIPAISVEDDRITLAEE